MNRAKQSLLPAISLSIIMLLMAAQSILAQIDNARWDDGCGGVTGERFDQGAVILLNGERQKTKNDDENPATLLIAKKSGKKARHGDRLQVQKPDGKFSPEFIIAQ